MKDGRILGKQQQGVSMQSHTTYQHGILFHFKT